MSSTDGFVTVAKAAEILTANGDKIDPSNVSRYLARYPVIPSERRGKCRFVDLAKLVEHRRTNVFVADKQAARGTETAAVAVVVPSAIAAPRQALEPLELTAPEGDSSLAEINKEIKRLDLRRRQREEDEADGKVIPAEEVLVLVSTAMRAMIGELERQEVAFAQKLGRDVSIEFRKARKAAQAKASAELIDLAKKSMPAALAAEITNQSIDGPQDQTI